MGHQMRIVDVAGMARFSDEKMQKVGLFETDRLFVDLYCLKPGQAQRLHNHPASDKVYYVLSGRAIIRVGGEEGEVAAGEAVLAPCGAEHGVRNSGPHPLTLLVVLAPKPV
jgi:mannose-6-phosphate isomerase-like protein (cupin superfamily)